MALKSGLLRVAYVHDWLVVNGGAEKVAKSILKVFPEADVFSLIDYLSESDRDFILNGKRSKTTFIQNIPFSKKIYRYLLHLFPRAIESLDLRDYDLIISSSYSVAKGVLTNSEQTHICYCHSPARYFWDMYHEYISTLGIKGLIFGRFIKKTIHKLRIWDVASSNRVDFFIANSQNVAKRIKKIYRRESEVICPPVDTEKFTLVKEKSDYFITASRHVPYKRTDLIVSAFKQMPDKKLIVLGNGPELKKLKKMATKNIYFKGHVSHNEMIKDVSKAKAFIFAANEDFGIVPLEAQATGTPVIAFGKGGSLETVKNNKTGLHFMKQNEESLVKTIKEFEEIKEWDYEYIRSHALAFDKSVFEEKIRKFVGENVGRK